MLTSHWSFVQATDADGPLQGGGKVFYNIQSINTDATVFQVRYYFLKCNPPTGKIRDKVQGAL